MAEPQAAVAIVHAGEPEDSILLIRRTERHDDPWSGHWCFPGGRREPEDRDLLHTALRELEEECGVRLDPEQLEAPLPPASARRLNGQPLLVAPFLLRVDGELETVLHPAEAAEGRWVPVRVLRDPARHCLRPVPGRPPEMLYPSLDLSAAPLWGFTYRLITVWLQMVPEAALMAQRGLETAGTVLQFLLAAGLKLRENWHDRTISDSALTLKAAVVEGSIPTAALTAQFSLPGKHVDSINLMEVTPGYVRLLGLDAAEYVIYAADSAAQ